MNRGFWTKYFPATARASLAIIYIWFGLLKVLGLSPAAPMIRELEQALLPFVPFDAFYLFFAGYELAIGMLFLFPHLTKWAAGLFATHQAMTALPLVFLPALSWQAFLAPTLEGQYIIKNLALAACVIGLLAFQEQGGDANLKS